MPTDTRPDQLRPLSVEEYPAGTVLRVEDMTPLHRAFAEAEHEGCPDEPPGHLLSAHEPWSGGDLDGVETWESFMARLSRHGLTLTLADEGDETRPLLDWSYGNAPTYDLPGRCLTCGQRFIVRREKGIKPPLSVECPHCECTEYSWRVGADHAD